jgi:hypothetical protein
LVARNRFGDSAFHGGASTYLAQSVDFAPSGTTNGPAEPLSNAGKVFDGSAVGEIPADAKCYWSPTASQWTTIMTTAPATISQIGVGDFPDTVGAPTCWRDLMLPRQIVYKPSVGTNTRGGSYAGAPALLLLRPSSLGAPSVAMID